MPTLNSLRTDLRHPLLAQIFVRGVLAFLMSGLLVSLLGYWIGSQQQAMIYLAAGAILACFVIAGLRQRTWALIPLGWAFSNGISLLPFPLSIREIFVLLSVGAAVTYTVFRQSVSPGFWHGLDLALGFNMAWLAYTFVLHPVGLYSFGADTVGGRPYWNIFVALMALWVMVRLCKSEKAAARIPLYTLIGTGVYSLLNVIAYSIPSLTPILFFATSAVDTGVYRSTLGAAQWSGIVRLQGLAPFGMTLVLYLCACYPTASLFNPGRRRFYFLGLGLICIALSGFRSDMLVAMTALCFGAWLHGGWRHFLITTLVATLLFGLVTIGQGRLYELPLSAQRALSFLPGNWSAIAVEEARGSSEGRFAYWEKIIKYKMIQNWWSGDGFGISQRDMLGMGQSFEEDIYTSGGYHNGPLSAIRYAGVIGLFLLYALAIGAAVSAYRCVKACRGTMLFPLAVFLAIQLIWGPINYTFVFGGYDSYLPGLIFQLAALRVLLSLVENARKTTVQTAVT